jgi:hypothetical protein
VHTLSTNPSYKFIWSEIKWFEMWWPEQSDNVQVGHLLFAWSDMVLTPQQTFRRLVQNGQIEFVGAGWSQSDEVRCVGIHTSWVQMISFTLFYLHFDFVVVNKS